MYLFISDIISEFDRVPGMFYCHRMKGEGVSKNADKYWVTPQSTHTQSQESLLLEGFSSIVLPTFRVWSKKKDIFIRSFDF